jgi:protein phosphatase methylesterase 1
MQPPGVLSLSRGSFTTYQAGSAGAVVFCLHGGGYTGLTWSLVAKQLKQQ